MIKGQKLKVGNSTEAFDVHFTPMSRDDSRIEGVLIMFGPVQSARPNTVAAGTRKSNNNDKSDNKSNNKNKSTGNKAGNRTSRG